MGRETCGRRFSPGPFHGTMGQTHGGGEDLVKYDNAGQAGVRPLRPQPQRADAPGQPLVRAAGLAGRPEPGWADGAAAGGPGPRPLYPDLVRSGDAGSGVAWTGLGQRAGVSEPPDRRLPGRFCPAGGGRTDLSLLLHPGGAAGRLRRRSWPVWPGAAARPGGSGSRRRS